MTNAALEIDALGGMNFPDGLTGTGTLTIMSRTTTSPVTCSTKAPPPWTRVRSSSLQSTTTRC